MEGWSLMPRGEKTVVVEPDAKAMTEEEIMRLPKTLTSADVARLMRISSSKVCDLAKSGAIPAVKIGQTWRFDRDVVMNLIGLSMTDVIASANRRRIAEENARSEWERSMRDSDPVMLGQGQVGADDVAALRALMGLLAKNQ